MTLAVQNRPDNDSGEILIRDYLEGPVYNGKEGIAWGYVEKKFN